MNHNVTLCDVTVRFGEKLAVDNLSLNVKAGEMVAIVGATGAGKSTVLNLILGNLEPTEGEVRVLGYDPRTQGENLRGKVSVAFQQPSLLPWRKALSNVVVGPEILGWEKERARKVAQEWLDRVGLTEASDRFPYQLSGGMRQRVSLARALAIEPELLLLDEAFSALDEYTAQSLRTDFARVIRAAQVTCILVTHNLAEAFEITDRVVVFGAPAVIVKEYLRSESDFDDSAFVEKARKEIHRELSGGGGLAAPLEAIGRPGDSL